MSEVPISEKVKSIKLSEFVSYQFIEAVMSDSHTSSGNFCQHGNYVKDFFRAVCKREGIEFSDIKVKEFPFEKLIWTYRCIYFEGNESVKCRGLDEVSFCYWFLSRFDLVVLEKEELSEIANKLSIQAHRS